MKRALLALTGVAVLGLATLAFANGGSKSDPSGDVKHNPPGADSRYDIVKIAYNRAADGKVTATVKTKGKVFGPNAKSGARPVLWIDVPGKVASRPGCQYSDYFVAGGEVDQCGDGPKTGGATIKKVNSHTLKFTFALDAIGNPPRFGIAFVTEGTAKGKLVLFDRAPDKGFFTAGSLTGTDFVPTEGNYSGTDSLPPPYSRTVTFTYSGRQLVSFRVAGNLLFPEPIDIGTDGQTFSSTQPPYAMRGGWDDATHVHGSFKHSDGTGTRRFFHVQLVNP
jgi:hypothetical protein